MAYPLAMNSTVFYTIAERNNVLIISETIKSFIACIDKWIFNCLFFYPYRYDTDVPFFFFFATGLNHMTL